MFSRVPVRLLGVVSLVFGVMAVPTTASAGPPTPISDILVFNGSTDPGFQAVKWQGGSGTFSFSSNACAGISGGDIPGVLTPEVGIGCSVSATGGTYRNTVCGTGQASGTANIGEGASLTTPSDVSGGYSGPFDIVFVGTVGLGQAALADSDGGTDNALFVTQLRGTPQQPAVGTDDSGGVMLTGNCVGAFDVSGVAVAVEG